MEKEIKDEVFAKEPFSRVQTDAIHRRFNVPLKVYYCDQCCIEISVTSNTQIELRDHFKSVKHESSGKCVYCSEPVYVVLQEKEKVYVHKCENKS